MIECQANFHNYLALIHTGILDLINCKVKTSVPIRFVFIRNIVDEEFADAWTFCTETRLKYAVHHDCLILVTTIENNLEPREISLITGSIDSKSLYSWDVYTHTSLTQLVYAEVGRSNNTDWVHRTTVTHSQHTQDDKQNIQVHTIYMMGLDRWGWDLVQTVGGRNITMWNWVGTIFYV